jgi:hypothetical protein
MIRMIVRATKTPIMTPIVPRKMAPAPRPTKAARRYLQ